MIRGLGAAASGMRAEQTRLDVLANNLANAATTGYKRDTAVTAAFTDILVQRFWDRPPISPGPAPFVGALPVGVGTAATAARLTTGPLRYTGGALDVALSGDGFFVVQTPAGVRYTRDGAFTQDAAGRLTTNDGYPVLAGGQPVGTSRMRLAIQADGTVTGDGAPLGKLDIVTSAQLGGLRKEGNSLWVAAPGAQGQLLVVPPGEAAEPHLQVGFLEGSNVEPVLEMVDLIATIRAYEADQKAIQAQDQTLGKVVNDVGQA